MNTKSVYFEKKTKLDWDIVNSYKTIYSFYFNIQNSNISNPEYKIPINFIEILEEELNKEFKEKNIKLINTNDIFRELQEKYNIKYSQLLYKIKEIINLEKPELIEINSKLKKEELNLKSRILNSNRDFFISTLKKILEPQGYFLEDYSDNISIKKDGSNKGQVYKREDNTYYLKCFSAALGGCFNGFTHKQDNIFLSDIAKNNEVNLSDYIEVVLEEQTKQSKKDIKSNIFTTEENSTILQIENLNFQPEGSIFNEFINEYNKRNTLLNSKLSNVKDSNNFEILKELKEKEMFEFNICTSFDKIINIKHKDIQDKMKTLKELRENILNYKEPEKIKEYYYFVLNLFIIDTLDNRNKFVELLNVLNNSKTKEVKNIIKKIQQQKNYNFEDIKEAEKNFREKLFSIEDQDIRLLEKLFSLKNDIDIGHYQYFNISKENMNVLYDFKNREILIEFLNKFKNEESNLSLEYGMNQDFSKFNKLISKFSIFDNKKINFLNKTESDFLEIQLKILNNCENHFLNKSNYNENHLKEVVIFSSISKILLMIYALKNNIDTKIFKDCFFKKEDIDYIFQKLEKFKHLNVKIPLEISKYKYELNDELKEVVIEFMNRKGIEYNKQNNLIQNQVQIFRNLWVGKSPIVQDYILLKRFVIDKYNEFSQKEKYYLEKHGFDMFFFDFNSIEKSKIFNELTKKISTESFLNFNLFKKLDLVKSHMQDSLNYNSLIDIELLYILEIMKNVIEDNNNKISPLYKDIEIQIRKDIQNPLLLSLYKKQLEDISDKGILLSKYNKTNFFSKDLKVCVSLFLEKKFNYKNIITQSSADLKLQLSMNKNNKENRIKTFMDYSYQKLQKVDNKVLKYRTRYVQLAFLVLQVAYNELVKNKIDETFLESFFRNKEDYLEFKKLATRDILIKNKNGFPVVHPKQQHLKEFLYKNKMEIIDCIKNFQGYVPTDELEKFIIKDLYIFAGKDNYTSEEKNYKSENYLIDMLGIVRRNKLSYNQSILTPEIILSENSLIGGLVTGYNLRVTNKKEMDEQKLTKILSNYLSQFPHKDILLKYYKKQEYTNEELIEIIKNTNKELKEQNLFYQEWIETPKEPATKGIITTDINLEQDSKILKKIPSIFANIINLRNMDFDKPITIHLNEGVKDSMSLNGIIKYSQNKNQIVLPLQGTKGFKDEFGNFLFNLNNQPLTLKLWADMDYAGLTLLNHLDELIKEKYPNITLVAMNEFTFINGVKEEINKKGFKNIKGMDLTDWSVLKQKEETLYKKNQVDLIDNFNKPFSKNSEFYKLIARESLKLEVEKWKEDKYSKVDIQNKSNKFLQDIGIKQEENLKIGKQN